MLMSRVTCDRASPAFVWSPRGAIVKFKKKT